MKKIRLSLDALTVTSFATVAPEPREHGTVQGNYMDTKEVCDSTRVARDCVCSRYCPSSLCTAPGQPGCIVPH
jgi:hypothetical protein